jgi:hypothetical protein
MIVIDKWAGLVTNASPYSLPPGAAVTQVNLQVIAPGSVTVRPGLAAATFASSAGGSSPVRSTMRYPGATDSVVHQNSSGVIYVSRGAS